VNVKPEIFVWVQEQIEIDSLPAPLIEKFNKWSSGEKEPTFRQLEKFSKATNIPLGYFFLDELPVEKNDLIEFRTVDSVELTRPSRELIDTINEMENIQEWMKDYLLDNENEPLKFVASVNDKHEIADVVANIRDILSLEVDWYMKSNNTKNAFKYIRTKLEEAGILVMMNGIVGANTYRSLDINEFRAFTMVDDYAPLIFINSKDASNARLFSLFHEVAHIWYGTNSLYNDRYGIESRKNIEIKCNAIAAELILPNDNFLRSWDRLSEESLNDKLSQINREFKSGMTVAARRALDNNKISKAQYYKQVDIAMEIVKAKANKKQSGGDYYKVNLSRIDHRLLFAMNSSVYEGKSAFTDVYRLTNTNRRTFDQMVQRASGGIG
jgi:Zn-dependent peptidase ImmA (M78 family)